jgi:2-polyprenyl-3-methyl-5-hydroxy-6-metoxy-1,4-benzoquinol methylase
MWNADAVNWVEGGRRQWARSEPVWGMWEVPETQVRILPDVRALDVIDLGCGTGYWCAWLSRLGARPVGIDVSEAQLQTARALQDEHGLSFPLIHASAEAVPLPDACCDPGLLGVRRRDLV